MNSLWARTTELLTWVLSILLKYPTTSTTRCVLETSVWIVRSFVQVWAAGLHTGWAIPFAMLSPATFE